MRIILRYRVLKGKLTKGHHSFYLDIYQDEKRDYEPLNVIVNPLDKANYRKAVQFCEDVAAKRRLEINRAVVGFRGQSPRRGDFVAYCEQIIDTVTNAKSRSNWRDAITCLAKCEPNGLEFQEIDNHWLQQFQKHLLEHYAQNTARTYSTKIRQAITKAQKDGYLTENPNRFVMNLQQKSGQVKKPKVVVDSTAA